MSILADSVLCAVNVGKHSSTNLHLLLTAESTLEKFFVCVVKVENHLVETQPLFSIEKFIQEQSSTSAANVENP